ncbi:aldehyde dehydrogenase family protein [Neobacillus sp. OS1-2]|uniref:aldehyde dehydrogenase family protein n=1 Tax=Neobacillus sp. OS1-2 TaxID=3070680 RepID=UPI0027E145FF|nr:aldehyde dehydrogenase family protein [Neobacillus sp. OS1-2]WML39551.1 aldehyde dehydrogenase family protein [Neobacillus sp. OS1-2]
MEQKMYINSEWVKSVSGEFFPTYNPANHEVIARVPRGNKEDVHQAVTAAKNAFESNEWQSVKPGIRGNALSEVARKVRERSEELALIETLDTGKPLSQARSDVESSARYFEYYAGVADKMFGETIPVAPNVIDYTVREPMGVCAQVIPWNYPLQITSRGVAAAIAVGNTVVVKPAEDTPLSALKLAEIFSEIEVLKGALHVVTGYGTEAGAALVNHPDVNHITFTGSVNTGTSVMISAAKNIVPVTLELGGKSPHIVFPDCDMEEAVTWVTRSIIQNAGQTCSAGSRLLIHSKIKDEWMEKLIERMKRIKLGPGVNDSELGPIISKRQFDRILAMVERAKEQGARVIMGGRRAKLEGLEDGYYFEPTIIENASPMSEIAQEEVFGPVLTVFEFETEMEAITLANGTSYGLVTGIWTNDLSRAHRIASKVKSGQVFINDFGAAGGVELPFGGYKKSGIGREKGVEALRNYTQLKNIAIKIKSAE